MSTDGCVGVYTKVFVHNTVFLSVLVHIIEQTVLQWCGGSQLHLQFFALMQFFFLFWSSSHLARPSDCDKCFSISCTKGTFTGTPHWSPWIVCALKLNKCQTRVTYYNTNHQVKFDVVFDKSWQVQRCMPVGVQLFSQYAVWCCVCMCRYFVYGSGLFPAYAWRLCSAIAASWRA